MIEGWINAGFLRVDDDIINVCVAGRFRTNHIAGVSRVACAHQKSCMWREDFWIKVFITLTVKQPLQGTIKLVTPNILKRSTFFRKYSLAKATSPDSQIYVPQHPSS
jgi:hypothetical protein